MPSVQLSGKGSWAKGLFLRTCSSWLPCQTAGKQGCWQLLWGGLNHLLRTRCHGKIGSYYLIYKSSSSELEQSSCCLCVNRQAGGVYSDGKISWKAGVLHDSHMHFTRCTLGSIAFILLTAFVNICHNFVFYYISQRLWVLYGEIHPPAIYFLPIYDLSLKYFLLLPGLSLTRM